jgi:uncharacterized protein YbdZ (MbtH family)
MGVVRRILDRPTMSEDTSAHLDDLTIDGDLFIVLINAEGQHSLWPAAKAIPGGWSLAHPAAGKAECLAYVETHWTDLRPASLRQAMARDAGPGSERP